MPFFDNRVISVSHVNTNSHIAIVFGDNYQLRHRFRRVVRCFKNILQVVLLILNQIYPIIEMQLQFHIDGPVKPVVQLLKPVVLKLCVATPWCVVSIFQRRRGIFWLCAIKSRFYCVKRTLIVENRKDELQT